MDNIETMTLNELDNFLTEQNSLLRQTQRTLDAARGRLSNANRMSGGSEWEGLRRDAAIKEAQSEISNAERRAEEEARAVRQAASRVVEATRGSRITLTDAEISKAADRTEFVKQDCETLSLPRLLDRIREAMQADDRPTLYCFLRHGRARVAGGSSNAGKLTSSRESDSIAEIRSALRTIESRLADPSVAPLNKRASEITTNAGSLERSIRRRQSSVQRFTFQNERERRWPSNR